MDELLIDETDVDAFKEKLESWAAGQTDADRAILQLIMVRAFPESEVEGFGIVIEERLGDGSVRPSGYGLLLPAVQEQFKAAAIGQRYQVGGAIIR